MNGAISLLIFSYNQEKYLRETLNSVFAQTREPEEIWIVDDFSTDGSREIIESYQEENPKIKTIFNEVNVGLHSNINRVINLAEGAFIVLLSADDLLLPHFIENHHRLLKVNGDLGLICSDCFLFEDKQPYLLQQYRFLSFEQNCILEPTELVDILRTTDFFIPSWTCSYRRELFLKYGGYQTELNSLSDYFINYQIALRHSIGYIPAPLSAYRLRADSYGASINKNFAQRSAILTKLLKLINQQEKSFKISFFKSKILSFNGLFLLFYLVLRPFYWPILFSILKKSWRPLSVKLGKKICRMKIPPLSFSPVRTIPFADL